MNYRKSYAEIGNLYLESTRQHLNEDDVRLDPREGPGMGGNYDPRTGAPLDSPAADTAEAHSALQQELQKHGVTISKDDPLDNTFTILITSGAPGTKVKVQVVGLE